MADHEHTQVRTGSKEWRTIMCHGLRGDDTKPLQGSTKGAKSLELMAWGGGYHGQLGVKLPASKKSVNRGEVIRFPNLDEPRHLACGGSFSAVVTSSGAVYTWGMGKHGQLGYELTAVSGQQPTPRQVTDTLGNVQVMSIACGREHTLVLSYSGDLFAWGSNKFGQLGTGDHHNNKVPVQLRDLKDDEGRALKFTKIDTGDNHSAAISSTNRLFTWGNGMYGQLGHGDPKIRGQEIKELRPRLVKGLDVPCKSVACGASQTSVISEAGKVYVMGSVEKYASPEGQHQPVTTCQFLYHPGLLDLKASVVQVACGKAHLILLTADEDVYSVGAGRDAQLGHGKRTDVVTARLILKGKKIFHVAAGRYHSVAITSHGTMYTWGSGEHGQLCHGIDGDEMIPRVVDSLLHRALLKASCGENHTVALCTAPIEDTNAELSPDMVVWRFHEHEEYEMKHAIAKAHKTGITKKHLKQVEVMAGDLMGQYQSALLAGADGRVTKENFIEFHDKTYGKPPAEADWAMFNDADGNEDGSISKSEFVKYCEGKGISEDDVETKFGTKPRPTSQEAARQEARETKAAIVDEWGTSGHGESGAPVEIEAVKEQMMQRVLKSADDFNNWLHWTQERQGKTSNEDIAMGKDALQKISHADHGPTLPPVSSRPPGGGGRGSKSPRPQATSPGGTKLPDVKTATPRQGGAALKKKPSKKVVKLQPKPPPPGDEREGRSGHHGQTVDIPREQMYAKLGELQAAVRKSVIDVVKDDPSAGIEKMEQELIALRDVCSSMEVQRRLRAEEIEGLRTDLDGLRDATTEDEVAPLLETSDALQVQLQAVSLKYAEEKENREVYEIVIQQLHDELNDQSHLISDLKDVQRENDLLLDRMAQRKKAAVELMVETKKEGRRIEGESKVLREGLNEHLMGVRKLVQYMERTVSHVTKDTDERRAKEREKHESKLRVLRQRLDDTLERKKSIRLSAIGAADALGFWLKKKFDTISDSTGYSIGDVDKIIDRIASRGEIIADLKRETEEKKEQVASLGAEKLQIEQELIEIRAQSSSEKTMRQIQLVTRQLEAQTNTAAKPKEKFQEAIMSMVRFRQLCLSLIRKVDYLCPPKTPFHSSEDAISVWDPVGNVDRNQVAFLELMVELGNRMGIIAEDGDDDADGGAAAAAAQADPVAPLALRPPLAVDVETA